MGGRGDRGADRSPTSSPAQFACPEPAPEWATRPEPTQLALDAGSARPKGDVTPESLLSLLGLATFRPGQQAGRPGGARRPRLARRHAHRRRQEPLLPAPGARQHRSDRRRLPADRPDARPVRAPDRPRPPRGHARLRRRQPAGARPDPPRPGDGRLRRPRALRLDRLPQRDRTAPDRPVRRRRGPLRLRVGSRLPPRLPAPRLDHQGARPPADDGLHRDGDAEGRRGDRHPSRPERAGARAIRLRPPEPQLRRPAVRRRRLAWRASAAR